MSVATADNRRFHQRHRDPQDTFEEACRRADEKRRREADPERLMQLRRLLDDSVSLERCCAELNQRHRDGAPQSTVEALVYELRTHGLAALDNLNCRRRLVDVSDRQLRDVLAELIRSQARCVAITNELLIALDRVRQR